MRIKSVLNAFSLEERFKSAKFVKAKGNHKLIEEKLTQIFLLRMNIIHVHSSLIVIGAGFIPPKVVPKLNL